MTSELLVLMGDQLAGILTRTVAGLRFTYDDGYRQRPAATPLSLSMPVNAPSYPDRQVTPWLWGLLPDNPLVLRRWGRDFDVSANSPFELLSSPVGEDCAGAVAFVRPDRLETALSRDGGIDWVDDTEIASRLRALRDDGATWLGHAPTGRFSLAGAQAKTALIRQDGRWGVPWGSIATSHILKPAIASLDDHDLNEHLCLQAARRCGLRSASSEILDFNGEQAVVVQRYDRRTSAGGLTIRVHQEDVCQALSVLPDRKYQNEGGPSSSDVAQLLRSAMTRAEADQDVLRFAKALIFNWLIGGTDAHAKNYSILLSGEQARLAPLYDLGSAFPYPDMHPRKLRLAMKFAGSYRLLIAGHTWSKLSTELGLAEEVLRARARDLIERVPQAFADAAADAQVRTLSSTMPSRLTDAVAARARECTVAIGAQDAHS